MDIYRGVNFPFQGKDAAMDGSDAIFNGRPSVLILNLFVYALKVVFKIKCRS